MITQQIQELEAARVRIAALESQIQSELAGELRALPARFGFPGVKEFIRAVRHASGKRRGRKPGSKNAVPKTRKRRRAKITEEMRAHVGVLINAGKTGREISKAVGISLPSVQNIKKALGLVKKR